MTGYNNWPSGYTRGFNAFKGGVYDGTNIWMIPYSTARVVKLNALTGEMTSYNNWPSGFSKASFAFVGGVHNGRNIWMIPNSADRIIKLKSRLNNDAGLTSVVGQNDSSPAGGNGQSEIERLIWNVNVGYEIERVGISDIVVADDATMNLYKNSNFTDGEIIGEESVELIAAGETTVYVKVTAEDSTTIRYYEVRINREGSSDAGLTSIVGQSDSNPSGGTGETELEVITWNVDVPYEKEKVGLSDIVVADNATMNLYTNSNFTDGETTGEDTVELIAAGETTVYVKVTAEDSTTIRYYEVRINREGSSNSNLATLLTSIGTLSPEFDTETKDYRVNVANSVSRIALTPIAEDENAIITVNGEVVLSGESSEPINLHVGTNTINIEVISEDNTNTKTYIVAVRRQASIDVSETLIPEENTTEKEEVAKEENEYTDSEDEREKEDTEFVDDRVITTTEVKEDLIEEQLNQNIRSITIPASENAQNVVARLNVETVKRIKEKEAEIEVKNDIASYRIPASEIMNDEITKQFGENAEGNNIVVDISVKRADSQKTEKLQNVSRANGFEVVANPVEFKVSVSQGEKRVEINRFNRYIERRIAIPENVDITRNITGVVLEEDGTVRQVPTRIVEVDGKYYAQIRSITNSVYSIISNPIEFKDAENHWARENLNDMGSRMIISGNEELIEPEREVTRGEFVGIVLRALGIRGERGIANFQDILEIADSDLGYIETVYEKGLVSGYEDGNFRGNEIITRQEAMVIISRAMKITGLDIEVSDDDLKDFITEYKDFATISEWAKSSVLQSIRAGIVVGRGNESLEVNKNLNISEAATMVRRLLQKSDLL